VSDAAAKKESFPVWLMHAFDRLVGPKTARPPKEYPPLPKGAGDAMMRGSGADHVPDDVSIQDDVGSQVSALERRRAIIKKLTKEEKWNK
jgi:hypothetical protein